MEQKTIVKCKYCDWICPPANSNKGTCLANHMRIVHKLSYRKEKVMDEIIRIEKNVLRDYIKEVLLDYEKHRLAGEGYDFYFRLSNDLDILLK